MTLQDHIRIVKTYSDQTIIGAIQSLQKLRRLGEWEDYRLRALRIVAKERSLT
jgi:hypothetical protein